MYIDERKKTYRDLNYKRFTFLSIWTAILSRISRAGISEARRRGISGNLSGDGLQNGGLLIVTKAGTRLLLNHREELPGDHVANDEILRILGITEVQPSEWVTMIFVVKGYSYNSVKLFWAVNLTFCCSPETSNLQKDLESQAPCEEECNIPEAKQ